MDLSLALAVAAVLSDEPRAEAILLDARAESVVAEYREGPVALVEQHRLGTAITPLLLAAALDAKLITLQSPYPLSESEGEPWLPNNFTAPPPATFAQNLRSGACCARLMLAERGQSTIAKASDALALGSGLDALTWAYGDFDSSLLTIAKAYGSLVRSLAGEGPLDRQVSNDVMSWMPEQGHLMGFVSSSGIAVGLSTEHVLVLWVDKPRPEVVYIWRTLDRALASVR